MTKSTVYSYACGFFYFTLHQLTMTVQEGTPSQKLILAIAISRSFCPADSTPSVTTSSNIQCLVLFLQLENVVVTRREPFVLPNEHFLHQLQLAQGRHQYWQRNDVYQQQVIIVHNLMRLLHLLHLLTSRELNPC